MKKLSPEKKAEAKELLKKLFRENFERRKKEKAERYIKVEDGPYDEIYFEGVAWLDKYG